MPFEYPMARSVAESQVRHVVTGLMSSCSVSARGRSPELAENAPDWTFTIFVRTVGSHFMYFKQLILAKLTIASTGPLPLFKLDVQYSGATVTPNTSEQSNGDLAKGVFVSVGPWYRAPFKLSNFSPFST